MFSLPFKSQLKHCLFQEAFPDQTQTGLGISPPASKHPSSFSASLYPPPSLYPLEQCITMTVSVYLSTLHLSRLWIPFVGSRCIIKLFFFFLANERMRQESCWPLKHTGHCKEDKLSSYTEGRLADRTSRS